MLERATIPVRFKASLALAVLLTSEVAFAQSNDAARDAARAHHRQGLALVEQNQFEHALEEFHAAFRASPQPAVLYNIGQTYIALGRPLEAVSSLEKYLSEAQAEIPPDRAEQVARQLSALKAKTAEITLVTRTPGALVELDGRALGRAPLPAPVRVMPGTHALSATGEDGSKLTRSVTLQAGDSLALRLDPPSSGETWATPTKSAERPVPNAPASTTSTPARSSSSINTTLGYVLGGVGVGLGAVAFGHYLWNLGRYEQWEETHAALEGQEQTPGYAEKQTANNELGSSIERASRVTVSLAVGGAALLGTGITLVVLDGGGTSSTAPKTGFALSLGGVW